MQNEDGLYEFGLGDWNAPKTLPQNITPLSLVASLCVLQMTRIMKYFYMELFGSDNGYSKKENALATEYALTLPSDSITDVIFPDGNTKKFISNEIPTNIKIEI